MKHYQEKLSEFINHELAQDERQALAEHLLVCAECRAEHDEIKSGAGLAGHLKQADAPENLWNRIENALDGKEEKASLFPNFAFFTSRGLTVAAAFLIVGGLTAAVYLGFFRNSAPEIVKNENQGPKVETPRVIPAPNESITVQNTNQAPETNKNLPLPDVNSKTPEQPQIAGSNREIRQQTAPIPPRKIVPAQTNLPSWNVETLAGMPKAGNQTIAENGKLTVGETLETDANSRALVQVANIGNVEIAPNSRVKLVNTKATEHRLALEKGEIKAKILAPPRLFIVDTPSAVAVDLGCEYTLEVDRMGNGRLHVTSGFVALERGGREAIVPAGAVALMRKGQGIGTPFAEDSSKALQKALYKFDFENGGAQALQTVIEESDVYDSITLWHLLARVPKTERGRVYNALANLVEPPAGVTPEGISRLDKKMLDAWWKAIEKVWFE